MKFSLQSTYICRLGEHGQIDNLPTLLKPLDRVIVLIPQSKALYRELSYDREYVSKAELEECVDNDLRQVSPWPVYGKYFLTHKGEQKWSVKVWIWSHFELESATHMIPEMAFKLGCLKPGTLLCWKDSETLFAALRQNDGPAANIWNLSQHHQQRRFLSWLSQSNGIDSVYYDEISALDYIDLPLSDSKKTTPDFNWLKAAQKENAIDISSPWGLRTLWSGLATLMMVWILATFGLIFWQTTSLDQGVESDALQLQQLQRQRSELAIYQKRVDALITEFSSQQKLTHVLDSLSKELPQNVVLSRIAFKDNKMELDGVAQSTNGLLEALEKMDSVSSAKFISDIVKTKEDKQRFSLELILKRGSHGI
ncbi:PilN domain-containing protein [Motilimonas sp. 1_MG-2023]|uniref:PilN domain-containing protein n=1 Tax=Motilimonas sp. 1_MG-2023 TaxID=3062672 RepID=UPI0026E4683F|nr:PilN domain-containing protein [Motilimonas sp. 1_MG-2023]MDO6527418.1 PilN domain-containing protein [Motilimonas sp. 1_MG-2023]